MRQPSMSALISSCILSMALRPFPIPSSCRIQLKSKFTPEDDIGVDDVSDAEALLACRAYLQRKNRLNSWTQAQQRKQQADRLPRNLKETVYYSGYFWEDPSDLKYFQQKYDQTKSIPSPVLEEEEEDTELSEEEESDLVENELWETISPNQPTSPIDFQPIDEGESLIEDTGDAMFDPLPSISYMRRSDAAKRTWSDPEFRSKWYRARWGNKTMGVKRYKQKIIEDRLRSIDTDQFLASQGLANMTEDEIADAIRTYVKSSRRRAESRKRTLKERREGMDRNLTMITEALPRDALLTVDTEKLQESRRIRSEGAAKAYKQRLANQQKQTRRKVQNRRLRSIETATSPQEAISKIQSDLDKGRKPCVADVKLILSPSKLSKRRETLRRILSDYFDLRGKCIPLPDTSSKEPRYSFVTQSSIGDIGSFVITKLENSD